MNKKSFGSRLIGSMREGLASLMQGKPADTARQVSENRTKKIGKTEWFRNTTWNESIEQAFNEKLHRARKKEQYLRIQACTLAPTHPKIALELLDRYFALPEDIDRAQAYVDKATALLELDRINEAIDSYEAALARESKFANIQTQAFIALPYLIATRRIKKQYERASELLQLYQSRLTFTADHFRWHAARALIAADSDNPQIAKEQALCALEIATNNEPRFSNHPTVGLVTKDYDDIIRQLKTYCTCGSNSSGPKP